MTYITHNLEPCVKIHHILYRILGEVD